MLPANSEGADRFTLRAYRDGDEQRILALFERCFHVRRSNEHFDWEYRRNPYGNRMLSLAFDEHGELVAHYAGYPVRFWHAGDRAESRLLPALHIGDTMTAPEVRHLGRGPTSLLGRTVCDYYARFCEHRVAFNYGVNTGKIQRVSMSYVRARRLQDIPFAVLDLAGGRPRPGLAARLAGYRCRPLTGFDARFDRFWERVRPAYRLLIERDSRYLEWRYASKPDAGYRIYGLFRWRRLVGWSVFQRRADRLLWGDGLFDPEVPAAPAHLLSAVLAAPEHAGVATVETWASERPRWWAETCARLGFQRRPEPQGLGLVFVPFQFDPEAAFRSDLYVAMGDCDLF